MLACAQLSVIALAALVACAVAHPGYGKNSNNYAPAPAKSPNVNAVIPLQSTAPSNYLTSPKALVIVQDLSYLPGPVETDNVIPSISTPLKDEELLSTTPSVTSTPEPTPSPLPEIPSRFLDESKPVNLRYPHAVLFGGTCGGSIIHPKWILTAGHCTLFTGGRYVLAGTNNSDDGSGITKKVKKLHIHPKFSVGPYWLNAENYGIKQVAARWDFLLAELEEPLELDGVNVASVPLEDTKRLPPMMYVGYAGYGTDHHGGFMRTEMHAMNLQTQDELTCKKLEQYSDRDMLCAKGYEPNYDSACNGDSGSGLVSGSGKLVGVASWVENDAVECKKNNLVVFSRVASAREWIRRVAGI